MTDKKLSILIPVYNVANYLSECLDSIMEQVDNSCEVIIYDDCSTDSSREILLDYKNQFPQIQLILGEKNKGVSLARNILFDKSQGDYIWFIDSDDFLNKDSINKVLDSLKEKTYYDVIIFDFIFFDKSKDQYNIEKCYLNNGKNYLNVLTHLRKNYIWNQVFNRRSLEGIRFASKKRFEDIIFVTDISDRIQSIKYIEAPLINYRYRTGSSVNSFKSIEYVDDYLFALNYRCNFIKNSLKIEKKGYLKYKIFNSYVSLIRNLNSDYKKHQDINETKKVLRYIKENYYDCFLSFANMNILEIDIFRYINLRIKLYKINKIFSKYDC